MFTPNNKLEIVKNMKREREGMPWTEDEIRFLVQRTLNGFYPDATAFALQRNKYEVIVKGLELELFMLERQELTLTEQEYLNIFNGSSPHPASSGAENYWNEFSLEPRNLDQIIYMAEVFRDIIWYNQHLTAKYRMAQGTEAVDPAVWERALAEAERIRQKYGAEMLGPYSDYEWGMLNGKFSALNWVLGCEWDMLDT